MAERAYARLGWKLVPAYLAGCAVFTAAMTTAAAAALVLSYLNGDSEQFRVTLAIALLVELGGFVAGGWLTLRQTGRTLRWLREGRESGVEPSAAWTTIVLYPIRLISTVGIGCCVSLAIMFPVYLVPEFDLTGWATAGVVIGIGSIGLFTWASLVFFGEHLFRPVVAEIATMLPEGWLAPRSHWNAGAKAFAAPLSMGMLTVGGAATFIPATHSSTTRLAVAAGVGLVVLVLVGLPLISLATATVLDPLRRLREGTLRVGRGDFTEPVPLTSADEFGDVVASFNRMQIGLSERETLSVDNDRLLEEVRASRARIVSSADAERRRVERNLHDGAQQRLVALALRLRLLEERLSGDPSAAALAAEASADLGAAIAELRDLARGLHPQVLTTGGLKPALEQLSQRSPVPVAVSAPGERYPDPVESTAYFVVSEALANVAKYASASKAAVSLAADNGALMVEITDDGVGGADPASGSGLSGLADRVAALDGRLQIESPSGGGTTVRVSLPLQV